MPSDIIHWIIKIPVLLSAITLHEYAHGRMAQALGDPTARIMGRLSFNPLKHLDLLGAICLFLFHFGWAKPVPIDMRYFKNLRAGMILVSLAGPLANIATALLAGVFLRILPFPPDLVQMLLVYLLLMNLGLGLFNLLPIPPLDGSHILENLLPPEAALKFQEWGRYGPLALMGVVLLDNVAHTGIIGRILIHPMRILAEWFSGIPF